MGNTKINFPDIQLTNEQSIWLKKCYELIKKSVPCNYKSVLAQLVLEEAISIDFNPNEINTLYYQHDEITLLGILKIDAGDDILNLANIIFTHMRTKLITTPNRDAFHSSEISKDLNISESEVSIILKLVCKYGTFYSGATGMINGIFGYERIDVRRDDIFREFLKFKAVEILINNKIAESNTIYTNSHEIDEDIENNDNIDLANHKKEYTTARQALAVHYIFEYLKIKNVDKTAKARFIEFLTSKSYSNIYKLVKNPLSKKREKEQIEDLRYIKKYFEDLDLTDIIKMINKDIDY